jgi:predicted transcriptional regulator
VRDMNHKRSREMIMQRILEVCAHGASKTKIVYQSNLNFTTVNTYMDQLLDSSLLEVEQRESTLYKTTKKGAELMKCLKQHHDEISRVSSVLVHTMLIIPSLGSLSAIIA